MQDTICQEECAPPKVPEVHPEGSLDTGAKGDKQGRIIHVDPSRDLRNVIAECKAWDIVEIAPGTYDAYLQFNVKHLTVRAAKTVANPNPYQVCTAYSPRGFGPWGQIGLICRRLLEGKGAKGLELEEWLVAGGKSGRVQL